MLKNKGYTLINVIGLSLGIVSSLVIFSIIRLERGFDSHHDDVERIYRLVTVENRSGDVDYKAGIPYSMPEALTTDFPEIEYLTLVDRNFDSALISIKNESGTVSRYREERGVTFVNSDYFNIFQYQWLMGDPEKALDIPNAAVISTALARKYFGDENPMGKEFTFNNELNLQITGVVEDTPSNTDLPFNLLIAFDGTDRGDENSGNIYS